MQNCLSVTLTLRHWQKWHHCRTISPPAAPNTFLQPPPGQDSATWWHFTTSDRPNSASLVPVSGGRPRGSSACHRRWWLESPRGWCSRLGQHRWSLFPPPSGGRQKRCHKSVWKGDKAATNLWLKGRKKVPVLFFNVMTKHMLMI